MDPDFWMSQIPVGPEAVVWARSAISEASGWKLWKVFFETLDLLIFGASANFNLGFLSGNKQRAQSQQKHVAQDQWAACAAARVLPALRGGGRHRLTWWTAGQSVTPGLCVRTPKSAEWVKVQNFRKPLNGNWTTPIQKSVSSTFWTEIAQNFKRLWLFGWCLELSTSFQHRKLELFSSEVGLVREMAVAKPKEARKVPKGTQRQKHQRQKGPTSEVGITWVCSCSFTIHIIWSYFGYNTHYNYTKISITCGRVTRNEQSANSLRKAISCLCPISKPPSWLGWSCRLSTSIPWFSMRWVIAGNPGCQGWRF